MELDFYGQGKISSQKRGPSSLENFVCYHAVRVQGELSGLVLIAADSRYSLSEASVLAELANVLGARFVEKLSQVSQLDLLITPPREIKPVLARSVFEIHPDHEQDFECIIQGNRFGARLSAWISEPLMGDYDV